MTSFRRLTDYLGYGGYVQAVKSENIFGKTYGTATYKSVNKKYTPGIDVPPEQKYKSMNTKTYKDQVRVNARTASKTVGVIKEDDTYTKPMDPATVNKFYGIPSEEQDELVKQQELAKSACTFYGHDPKNFTHKEKRVDETEEEAFNKFFGVEDKKEVKLGNPIPGYSGTNRRVQADNIFGMTYAEA